MPEAYGALLVIETCFGFLSMAGPTTLQLKSGMEVHFTKMPGVRTIRYEKKEHAELAVRLLLTSWPAHVLNARVIPISQAVEECLKAG